MNAGHKINERFLGRLRGLRGLRYLKALGAFFCRKNDVLVVQAQEGVDQEVNHPILP